MSTKAALEGLSFREFGRRDGCSEALVRRRVRAGYLPTLPNGRISAAYVGTAWRASASPGARPVSSVRGVRLENETPEEAAERIVFREGRVFETEDEAKRHKQSFLALLRELEYDRKSGFVVEIADSLQQLVAEYSVLRTRLLAIPNKVAPRAALLSSQKAIEALVKSAVDEALEALTADNSEQNSAVVAARARARKASRSSK
ncbi:hypothetical protein IYW40_09105 [Methylocystis sp. H4A]|uniref:hypothetical protein n=1 Tax=Methylocystis sp. H4A TaxID=2785788 RepID=UPI0018C2E015|nr:hypothetical protein [Methylocystis sp. H4A]MBG0801641.1 hypothetical protein [Methylocystis sp. H4A]